MIVGIHQPAYLPWLGYFDRIKAVDLFIYLDTVQFQKGSFQNRNKILTPKGPMWLTVPVETAGKLYTTELKDVGISNTQRWQAKHLGALKANYGQAPYFQHIFPKIEKFYQDSQSNLSDLCWEMLMVFNDILDIRTKIVRSSDMGEIPGQKSDLILNMCRHVNATTYLSGSQGRNYLDENSFFDAGIAVSYQNYTPWPYPQSSEIFVPAMGVVDYLFNSAEPHSMFA